MVDAVVVVDVVVVVVAVGELISRCTHSLWRDGCVVCCVLFWLL